MSTTGELTRPPQTTAAPPSVGYRVPEPPRFGRVPGEGRLELRGAAKIFRGDGKTQAVQGIPLPCEPGEFVVVVGPRGCGKSTLLNIAAGMVKPDAGTAT